MTNFPLLWLLPFVTFALVIGFVFWSKHKTEQKRADGDDLTTPLARSTPDPNLSPDPRVTDPQGVMR